MNTISNAPNEDPKLQNSLRQLSYQAAPRCARALRLVRRNIAVALLCSFGLVMVLWSIHFTPMLLAQRRCCLLNRPESLVVFEGCGEDVPALLHSAVSRYRLNPFHNSQL